MHELPWITIFGWRVKRFANNFHEWRSHEWKSLANRITSDSKIVIHGNECIILFLTRCLMSWTHYSAKTIVEHWIRHCRHLPIIFTSDEVTSENHWQIASRVTQKSLFTVTNVLFYFLHAVWCLEHTIPLKQLSSTEFAIVAKDSLFWSSIVTSPQLIYDVTRM